MMFNSRFAGPSFCIERFKLFRRGLIKEKSLLEGMEDSDHAMFHEPHNNP